MNLHSPLKGQLDKPADTYDRKVLFAPARPLFVEMPFHYAMADGYIDDIITVVLEEEDWVSKTLNAAPLVIHSLF